MTAPRIAVLDYGSGNVHSAATALSVAGGQVELTRNPRAIYEADGLVVPGVGAFAAVIRQLREVGGDELIARRLQDGRRVLGICVGQQILFEHGSEHGIESEGLGYFPGTVQRLQSEVLPHMGWTTVDAPKNSTLFAGVEHEHFYFVHSYAATAWPDGPSNAGAKLTWATHGEPFIAAIEQGPLSSTQFHPEKSGSAGLRLLRNWVTSTT